MFHVDLFTSCTFTVKALFIKHKKINGCLFKYAPLLLSYNYEYPVV